MGIEDAIERARRVRRLPSPRARRALRIGAGVSQEDIAADVGTDRASIARYELGTRTPRGEVLERYLAVLDRLAREVASGE
jgi:transcriptional regulator with XRE-family HTH domain